MEDGGLRGFTVAITADRRRDEQAVLFSRSGLEVLSFPLLATGAESEADLAELTALMSASPPDLLLANTGYGMRSWLALAQREGLLEPFVKALTEGTVIGARGAKALGELRKVGLDAVYRAPSGTLGELVAWALGCGVAGQAVAFQEHGAGSPGAVAALRAAGARVTSVPVYHTVDGAPEAAASLVTALLEGVVDVVTFTAAPQVEVLAEAAAERPRGAAVLERFNSGAVIAACIGPVCAAAARDAGIVSPLVPEHARLGSLATAVAAALRARRAGREPSGA